MDTAIRKKLVWSIGAGDPSSTRSLHADVDLAVTMLLDHY